VTQRMRTTKLGDLAVSAQGLGCMGMSEWYGAADWDESIATIHRALDDGVTFLDTADIYGAGHNEVLVGRAISGRRTEVQLATKFGIDRSGGDGKSRVLRGERSYVKRAAEAKVAGQPVRRDDDPEVFKSRLAAYGRDTAAVTPFYRERGLLREVDGMASIDEVATAIDRVLLEIAPA